MVYISLLCSFPEARLYNVKYLSFVYFLKWEHQRKPKTNKRPRLYSPSAEFEVQDCKNDHANWGRNYDSTGNYTICVKILKTVSYKCTGK